MRMLLGTAVENRREVKKWKVCELAKKVKVEPEFITQIEKGRRLPSEKILERMIKALGIDLKPYYYADKHPGITSYLRPDIVMRLKSGKAIIIESKTTK